MQYNLKTKRNREIDFAIIQFDKQIKEECRYAEGDVEKCPSYWQKLIFLKSMNMDLSDWRKMRVGDYWSKRDSLRGLERYKFIYSRLIDYLE